MPENIPNPHHIPSFSPIRAIFFFRNPPVTLKSANQHKLIRYPLVRPFSIIHFLCQTYRSKLHQVYYNPTCLAESSLTREFWATAHWKQLSNWPFPGLILYPQIKHLFLVQFWIRLYRCKLHQVYYHPGYLNHPPFHRRCELRPVSELNCCKILLTPMLCPFVRPFSIIHFLCRIYRWKLHELYYNPSYLAESSLTREFWATARWNIAVHVFIASFGNRFQLWVLKATHFNP